MGSLRPLYTLRSVAALCFLRRHSPIRPIPPSLHSPMFERQHDRGGKLITGPISCLIAANPPYASTVRKKSAFFLVRRKNRRSSPASDLTAISSSYPPPTEGGRKGEAPLVQVNGLKRSLRARESQPPTSSSSDIRSQSRRGEVLTLGHGLSGGGRYPPQGFFLVAAAYVRLFWRGLKPPSPSLTQRSPPKKTRTP